MTSTSLEQIKSYLTEYVIRGDLDGVRRTLSYNMRSLVTPVRPHWLHLQIATLQHNLPMAKLLVTWGAKATPEQLADFLATRGDTAAADAHFLKLAGVDTRVTATLAPHFTARAATPRALPEKLPSLWQTMLHALHELGAPEALIAGGALRDLHHGKQVDTVDIFIKEPIRVKTLLKRLAHPPAHLPYRTVMQQVSHVPTHPAADVAFTQVRKLLGARNPERASLADPLGFAQTWRIVTAEGTTAPVTFNIIMLGGELAHEVQRLSRHDKKGAATALLQRFDIGLCQIAHDGTNLTITEAYHNDAANKTLTLLKPLETSLPHIAAVLGKYPDHAPDAQLHAVLREGKTQAPLSHPAAYGFFHPRTMM